MYPQWFWMGTQNDANAFGSPSGINGGKCIIISLNTTTFFYFIEFKSLWQGCPHFFDVRSTFKMISSTWSTHPKCFSWGPEGGFGIAALALHFRQTHLLQGGNKMGNTGGNVFIPFCMEVVGFGVLCNTTDSWTKYCIGGLPTLEAMKGADGPFLMSFNQVALIQVTDNKKRACEIFVYTYIFNILIIA